MKLVIQIILSLAMLCLCLWLVWPDPVQRGQIAEIFRGLDASFLPILGGYLCCLATSHFCRAFRWRYLLRPLGVQIATLPLLAISTVGFLAILAFPARLGELVRPTLLKARTQIGLSEAIGTLAVERISDGLTVSVLLFVAFFLHHDSSSPAWMMPAAYMALGVSVAAVVFLVVATRHPEPVIKFAMKVSLLPRLAPRVAKTLEEKLFALVRGVSVCKDRRSLLSFLAVSACYWTALALGLWLLARGFGLSLPPLGVYACLALLSVGIALPNAPALVGQFEYFLVLGIGLYVGPAAAETKGLALAVVMHAITVIWYVLTSALALASGTVTFSRRSTLQGEKLLEVSR